MGLQRFAIARVELKAERKSSNTQTKHNICQTNVTRRHILHMILYSGRVQLASTYCWKANGYTTILANCELSYSTNAKYFQFVVLESAHSHATHANLCMQWSHTPSNHRYHCHLSVQIDCRIYEYVVFVHCTHMAATCSTHKLTLH